MSRISRFFRDIKYYKYPSNSLTILYTIVAGFLSEYFFVIFHLFFHLFTIINSFFHSSFCRNNFKYFHKADLLDFHNILHFSKMSFVIFVVNESKIQSALFILFIITLHIYTITFLHTFPQ